MSTSRVTISDVAEAAGVSRQTVSRAMNDMSEISHATREHVLQVARELRYRPSRFGRGLAKRDQRTIGLLVDELTNPYYPELASAVVKAASGRGWNVVVAESLDSRNEHDALESLVAQSDAVVGYASLGDPAIDDLLRGVPFVQIGNRPHDQAAAVVLDERTAVDALVEHLVSRGTRHPVVVTPDLHSLRVSRFVEGMSAAGLDVAPLLVADQTIESARAATEAHLGSGDAIDAALAFNDLMACGVLKALVVAGRRVPEDVRVIGVDGLRLGTVVTPELTTLAIDMGRVAEAAVEIAAGLVDGGLTPAGPGTRATIQHRLVLRASG